MSEKKHIKKEVKKAAEAEFAEEMTQLVLGNQQSYQTQGQQSQQGQQNQLLQQLNQFSNQTQQQLHKQINNFNSLFSKQSKFLIRVYKQQVLIKP